MTTELLDHKVLRRARRRLTRAGWVTIVEDLIDEKADRPEPIRTGTWPPLPGLVAGPGCWLDGLWPQRGPTPCWWGRSLQYEVGTAVVAALLRENRPARGSHLTPVKGAAA